ncbi:MAG: hypothetical protein AAB424_02170 [Patescibacteria group bacterium]
MTQRNESLFVSLETIPEEELSYLPKLCDEPREKFLEITLDFLKYLTEGKVSIEGLGEHLLAMESVDVSRQEAEALAMACYEHAAARGLTAEQRGQWFYNLMIVGCDPQSANRAFKSGHKLHVRGYGKTPELLVVIVAKHFRSWYLQKQRR